MTCPSINPATGATLARYEPADASALEAALDRARAFASLADQIGARAEDLVRMGVAEMGKPTSPRATPTMRSPSPMTLAWGPKHAAPHKLE